MAARYCLLNEGSNAIKERPIPNPYEKFTEEVFVSEYRLFKIFGFFKSELGCRGSRIRDITFEEKNSFCFEVFSTVCGSFQNIDASQPTESMFE